MELLPMPYVASIMDGRRKIVASVVMGMSVIAAFLYSLLSEKPVARAPIMAVLPMTTPERSLRVGAPVFAGSGTKVGVVSGISRHPDGRIERLRVTTEPSLGLEHTIIVRRSNLTIEGSAVRLALSVGELSRLPGIMLRD